MCEFNVLPEFSATFLAQMRLLVCEIDYQINTAKNIIVEQKHASKNHIPSKLNKQIEFLLLLFQTRERKYEEKRFSRG